MFLGRDQGYAAATNLTVLLHTKCAVFLL